MNGFEKLAGSSLLHRTSVRKFAEKPVSDGEVEAVLRAAMQAPSAGDQQPWEFYVVRDQALREELSKASPYAAPAAVAPVVIASAYRTEGLRFPEFAQIDMAIAQENMWLAADELGLGGVWLGIAPVPERMAAVERLLGIPNGLTAFSLFAMGCPARVPPQRDRFDVSRVHLAG